MDFDALVNEIVSRVSAKIAQTESQAITIGTDEKPRLLILTQQHGDKCHAMLESTTLLGYYQTECALLKEYNCDPSDYEAAILFGLTNDTLAKLACGLCDTPYLALASKLILLGKKIFVPSEEIELLQYADTAPPAYYAMLDEKLTLLKNAGVTVCSTAELEQAVLTGTCSPCVCCAAPSAKKVDAAVSRKVVTEKDMIAACGAGVTTVHVRRDAIITDLARDYVKPRRIEIVRD